MKEAIKVRNIDGTENEKGKITHFAKENLRINGTEEWKEFLITGLGKEEVVLGLPWVREHSGEIMWNKRLEEVEEELIAQLGEEHEIAAGSTYAQRIAEQWEEKKEKVSLEEKVPQYCWDYLSVFGEKELECLPEHKPWDHAIDLKEEEIEKMKVKVYPISNNKQ